LAGKSVSWRRDGAILERMRTVERLHLAGKSNRVIGETVGADESTIRNDLKRLNELWLETVKDEQVNLRAAVIAELEDTRVRALEAYDFDRRMEQAVLTGGKFLRDDGEESGIYHDDKGSASFRGGKSQALNVARQATMDKAKVLGIVVEKAALTDGDGNSLAELILKARSDADR
jgi:hypothetical protein